MEGKSVKRAGLKGGGALAVVSQQQLVIFSLRAGGQGGGRAAVGAQRRVSKRGGRRQSHQLLHILGSSAAHASPGQVLINLASRSILAETGDGRHLGIRSDSGGSLSAPGREVLGGTGGAVCSSSSSNSSRQGGGGGGADGGSAWQHHGVQLTDVGGETVNHATNLVHDGGALSLAANHPYADVAHAYDADVPAVHHTNALVGVPASFSDPGRVLGYVGG